MIQKQKQLDFQLDQLIQIVNPKLQVSHPRKPVTPTSILPPINQPSLPLVKTLRFKPWSGKVRPQDEEYQIIKQQINGVSENEDEGEGQPNKIQNYGHVSEINNDQIGYFYRFQSAPVRLIKHLLIQNGFKGAGNSKNWTIYWSSSVVKNEIYQGIMPYQKVNHFPNSFHITRKDLMNKCISKMQIRHGHNHFSFLPKTYILPQEMSQLQDQINRSPGITYIVKPHNRSQGKGITVTTQLSVIWNKLQKYSSLVVSHYVNNPLLINGLKFDLRIYVGILGINPLRIYVYQQGLARFATQSYDQNGIDAQNKRYQHLTNYSVNKKNTQFVKSQKQNEDYFGSKWSLTAMKDFLTFNVGKQETNQLFNRIDDLIIKTILSAENILYTAYMSNLTYGNACFQVLGFDVLIDSTLKPWLVEVNMSPSMNTDSPLDLRIKGNMIADLLTLTGVAPLSDRYLDGSHLRHSINNYKKADSKQVQLGPFQKFILREVKAENQRTNRWRRVFPCQDKRYNNFFQVDRYLNRLVRTYLNDQTTSNLRQSNHGQMRQISKNGYASVQNRQSNSMSKYGSNRINYMSVTGKEQRKITQASKQKVTKFSIKMNKGAVRRVHM